MKRRLYKEDLAFVSLLKACGKKKDVQEGILLHSSVAKKGLLERSPYVGSSLISMYAKCGMIAKARNVHDELRARRLASWNALIVGYTQQGYSHDALDCLDRMRNECIPPNAITYSGVLKACGDIGLIGKGRRIHEEIVSIDLLEKSIVVGNALVDMYAKCGIMSEAQQVLEGLPIRDVVSWSTLMARYTQLCGHGHKALNCFERMQTEGLSPDAFTLSCALKACGSIGDLHKGKKIHDDIIMRDGLLKKNTVLGTALVDMYAKCGMLEKAQQLHDELYAPDVISWSALISGYAKEGQGQEALKCFERMQDEGISPNSTTFISILKACGSIGAIEKGKQIHDDIVGLSLMEVDIALGNALIDMYVKCGALEKAQKVLDELHVRDIVSWNVLISGYAQQGEGHEAAKCFEKMRKDGLSPNSITFLCVLNACIHSGMLDKAQIYFKNMDQKYGIVPRLEHHACMVVGFGSAGHFDKAIAVMKAMPCSCDSVHIWLALLVSCKKWGNVKLGALAFDQALKLDPSCSVAYVLMKEIYAISGMPEDAEKVKSMRPKITDFEDGEI